MYMFLLSLYMTVQFFPYERGISDLTWKFHTDRDMYMKLYSNFKWPHKYQVLLQDFNFSYTTLTANQKQYCTTVTR